MPTRTQPVLIVATLSLVAALGCKGDGTGDPAAAGVAIGVAPLSLPGLSRVCYDLRVTNAAGGQGDVVWSRGTPGVVDGQAICSDRYGAGPRGDISFVGPCDASGPGGERENSVTVWVDSLRDTAGAIIDPNGADGWRDPCVDGCTLDVVCGENRDVPVTFDLTILRDANQGFFDVAVTFDDLFCSAKVDCQDDDGPLELLFNPATGARGPTVVAAFACTAGAGASVRTNLYRDPLVIACGADVTVLDPSVGLGNAYGASSPDPLPGDAIWQYAIYAGQESLACAGGSCNKLYWNAAIGLDPTRDNCRLTTAMTASDGPLAAFTTPERAAWPVLTVDVPLTDAAGLTCTRHPLNGGNGVATGYTDVAAPKAFAYRYDGAFAAASYTCATPCQNGGVCTGINTCTCVGDWQGATCDTLVCGDGRYGAAPPSGDGVCRTCTAIDHCVGAVTCTSASDSVCAACAPGYAGTTSCVDLDACLAHPCGDFGDCQDLPPPALGDADGRVCNCDPDWQGAECDTLVCGAGRYGAPPPSGDGICRSCTPIANCASGLTCTTAGDSTCGTCQTGYAGTTSCVNIDACATNPCGANANCQDLPPPALGDAQGRTCTCQSGFEGNAETGCTPIPVGCNLVQDGLVFAVDAANAASYSGSGTTWRDLSRRIACTMNGQTAFDSGDKAMIFTGVSGTYVGCGTSASPQGGTTQLTVSMWVKKPTSTADAALGAWQHSTRKGWFLQWFTDSRVYFGLSDGGVNNNSALLNWDSGWHHVTGVFDGTHPTARNTIYIDGVAAAATSASQLTSLTVTPAELRIGGLVDYASWSSASIAMVTVYNRALSAAEVQQNYASGRNGCSVSARWNGTTNSLLETVGSATAGYSLRALSSAYIDPLVRVRRADGGVRDLYARADGSLDTPTLATFIGSGDAFVTTWFDQTGAGRHATQATTASQPKLANAGAVPLVNGKPAMVFDGVDDYLGADAVASVFTGVDKPGTFVSVFKLDAAQYSELLAFGNSGNITEIFKPFSDDGTGTWYSNRRDSTGLLKVANHGTTVMSQSLMDAYFTGTTLSVYRNGAVTLNPTDFDVGTVGLNTFTLGAIRRTSLQGYARASFQEVLVYPSDRSASRSTIQGQLAAAYGITLGGQIVALDAGNAASYPGTGATWTDLSGANNHASLVGSPSYETAGGGTLTFTGSNYGNLGNIAYNRSAFSVFGWVRMNVAHTNWAGPAISKWYTGGGTAGNEFSTGAMGVSGPSPMGVAVQTNLGILTAQDTVNYEVGVWNHIGFTWDNGALRFYKNGVLVGSNSTTGTIATTTQPMALATFFDLSTYRTRASISTVAMHNRALTATEIQQAFDAQKARFGL